jgi:SAM-dependent methyltransferase
VTLPADRLERLRGLEGSHFWSVGRDRLVDNLIERYAMAAPYLDAGAGSGAYAQRLGPRAAWFDTGPVDRGGLRADVLSMPFPDNSFGTVLIRDVLEHVDDAAALDEAFRVLKPGGYLLVTVPAWPSLWGPRDELAGHLRRYRRRMLRRVVRQAGFGIQDLRGYQFVLLPSVIGMRWTARVLGRELAEREERVGRLNRFLTAVNVFEADLARRRHLSPPTGSSLVLVAVKP